MNLYTNYVYIHPYVVCMQIAKTSYIMTRREYKITLEAFVSPCYIMHSLCFFMTTTCMVQKRKSTYLGETTICKTMFKYFYM